MNDLILAALSTFGVCALVSDYDGPFELLAKLRTYLKAAQCTVCLSVWVAPVTLALIAYGQMWIIYSLATVGVVILIERIA